jgi:hypothetical protein
MLLIPLSDQSALAALNLQSDFFSFWQFLVDKNFPVQAKSIFLACRIFIIMVID